MANLCSLIAATVWLLLATKTGMAVSTTHALIGGMLGCGLGTHNYRAINWKYIGKVCISWVVAPFLSMIVCIVYYFLLRRFLLRSPNSVENGFRCLWLLVWLVSCSCTLFLTFENPIVLHGVSCNQLQSDGSMVNKEPCSVNDWVMGHVGLSFGIAFAAGTVLCCLMAPVVYWHARRRIAAFDNGYRLGDSSERRKLASKGPIVADAEMGFEINLEKTAAVDDVFNRQRQLSGGSLSTGRSSKSDNLFNGHSENYMLETNDVSSKVYPKGMKGFYQRKLDNAPWKADLHAEAYEHDALAEQFALKAEQFEPRTEMFFATLQIVSAAMACLVHGSNDVANAAAPFASIYSIYKEGVFVKTISVPVWILVLAGSAISVGLTIFGGRVIKTMGIELFFVSPSRGFCVEMAAATMMIAGSFIGIPLSTTHIAVGAMVGCGLLDRQHDPETGQDLGERFLGLNFSAINWKLVGKLAISWVATLIVTCVIAYLLFCYTVYSPTMQLGRYSPCSEWDVSCLI